MNASPALRTEQLFVKHLKRHAKLQDIDIVAASDRDARVAPVHIFAMCTNATPIRGAGPIYRCMLSVVFATHIDDTKTEERGNFVRWITEALNDRTEWSDEDAKLLGWTITGVEETSDGDEAGDAFRIIAGVAYDPTEDPEIPSEPGGNE